MIYVISITHSNNLLVAFYGYRRDFSEEQLLTSIYMFLKA